MHSSHLYPSLESLKEVVKPSNLDSVDECDERLRTTLCAFAQIVKYVEVDLTTEGMGGPYIAFLQGIVREILNLCV